MGVLFHSDDLSPAFGAETVIDVHSRTEGWQRLKRNEQALPGRIFPVRYSCQGATGPCLTPMTGLLVWLESF